MLAKAGLLDNLDVTTFHGAIERLRGSYPAVATYIEYHWTPGAYLATKYPYLNPSTDEQGRTLQTADIQRAAKAGQFTKLGGAETIL